MIATKKVSRERVQAAHAIFEGAHMGKRILEVLNEQNRKQVDLAKSLGVRPQTINFIIQHGQSSSLVVPIARQLRVSPHWLMTGHGQKTDVSVDSRFARLPVLTKAQTVDVARHLVRFKEGEAIPEVVTSQISEGSFACVIESEAMRSEILPGDLVIVDPSIPPVAGDMVLAIVNKSETFLRRYRVKSRDASGTIVYELYATHPDHETFLSTNVEIKLLGVVSEMRRARNRDLM